MEDYMKPMKTKFLATPFYLFGMMFLISISVFVLLLEFVINPIRRNGGASETTIILIILFVGVVPFLLFILSFNKCFSVITIDKTGIHRALFKRFLKKDFLWNEIVQMGVVCYVEKWLFIGKTVLDGMSYHQLLKNKEVMQVTFSPARYKAIRLYSDMKIQGFDDNK